MRLLGRWTLAVFVGFSAFFPFSAAALITVGAIETTGTANHVDVVGGLAYVTDGCSSAVGGLRILDVSNPAAPVQLGSLDTGDAQAVQVVGGLAYVAGVARACSASTFPSGLRIIDVSDPAAPAELGRLDTFEAWDVEVVGSLAYLADGDISLRIIDVSNPAAPVEVGRLDLAGEVEDARGVEVVGSLAYLADASDVLRIVDVSNPAAPVQLGVLAMPDSALDVEVAGGLAYVAAFRAGLRIVDVSDPSAPVEIGSISLGGGANGVELVGQLAYVSGSSGLWVIDVSNPAAPVALGGLRTPGAGDARRRPALVGALAYVPDGREFRIIDISSPSLPREVGALDTPGFAFDVELVGGLTYLADGASGLRIIDASNPAAPFELGSLDTPGRAEDVEVEGGFAYVADWTAGLRIIDVSDPAAPVEVGSLDTPSNTRDVEVVNAIAYLAASFSGLRIVDVSDPSAPVEIGALATPDSDAVGIEVVGTLAYVTNDSAAGLQIIDISSPAAPVLLATFVPSGSNGGVSDIAIVGNLAYLAASSGLIVLDVSNPAAPLQIGGPLDLPGPLVDVEVVGSLACVATGGGGLWAVDVSNPAAPFALGAPLLTTGGAERDVEVLGGLAYVANFFGGLSVISFGPEYAPKAPGPGPRLYEASLIFHDRANDATNGSIYPYSAPVFIARPLGARCNAFYPGGATCADSILQQGAPLAGSGTLTPNTMTSPPGFTLATSALFIDTTGSLPRYVPYYTALTDASNLRNAAGSFAVGGGPGSRTFRAGGGRPGQAIARVHAGANKFGGTMRILGRMSSSIRRFTPGLAKQGYKIGTVSSLFGVLGTTLSGTGAFPYYWTKRYSSTTAFVTARGVGWTTGTVSVEGTFGRPFPTSAARKGYDNRSVYGDGTIQLVTPLIVHWELSGSGSASNRGTGMIGILRLKFIPEPAGGLLLIAGIGLLGVLYRWRAR